MKRLPLCAAALLLLLSLLLLSAGCGEKPDGADGEKTLTVAICFETSAEVVLAAEEVFEAMHPGLDIQIQGFGGDYERYQKQITTQLLAGSAPDIMIADYLDYTKMSQSSLLADFYPLMEANPDFREEDYFMDVLRCFAGENGLPIFPLCFTYDVIGVNTTFSPELVEAYSRLDKVTYRDLVDLYEAFPDNGGRYLGENFDAVLFFNSTVTDFIDFENRTCAFNEPEFVDLLAGIKNGTDPDKLARGEIGWSYSHSGDSPGFFKEQAAKYLFYYSSTTLRNGDLFPYEDRAMDHFVPLANRDGRILVSSITSFCINAACTDQDLAFEFLRYCTTLEAVQGRRILALPIRRDTFQSIVRQDMEAALDEAEYRFFLEGDHDEILERTLTQLESWIDQPAAGILPLYSLEDTRETLTLFHAGGLTAEQTAEELQNRVTLWLRE